MTIKELPSNYPEHVDLEIPIKRPSIVDLKDLVAVCVPIILPSKKSIPKALRLRDCSLMPPSEPPKGISLSTWHFRTPDVITGSTKMSPLIVPCNTHVMKNPDLSLSFVTIYMKAFDAQTQAYLDENPQIKGLTYLRQLYTESPEDLKPLDTFMPTWSRVDTYEAYTSFFRTWLKKAKVNEDDIESLIATRLNLFSNAFNRFPFLVHRFFESHPNLHVLRHTAITNISDSSINAVSVRLDPERIAFAEVNGDIEGRTQLVF
ncbi:hypothetical protein [Neopusillimonas maritima]|uniref:Uncharacterized protein n=1 Tax=Neopusillimonas maritima TaxID=2026239 RepID=A0A3A1YS24_9BURK|nr:hypothetical protein [Neopusillimonas maritima]RIY41012.1 hypothetical protein CJP73_07650 [Neopusillimonas maritima]